MTYVHRETKQFCRDDADEMYQAVKNWQWLVNLFLKEHPHSINAKPLASIKGWRIPFVDFAAMLFGVLGQLFEYFGLTNSISDLAPVCLILGPISLVSSFGLNLIAVNNFKFDLTLTALGLVALTVLVRYRDSPILAGGFIILLLLPIGISGLLTALRRSGAFQSLSRSSTPPRNPAASRE